MKKILALSLLLGLFVVPIVSYAACGSGPETCEECLTEETCIAEVSCVWDVDCQYNGTVPIIGGDITNLLGYVGGMYTDIKLLILLAVGIPVAFLVIKRAMGLVPKK